MEKGGVGGEEEKGKGGKKFGGRGVEFLAGF